MFGVYTTQTYMDTIIKKNNKLCLDILILEKNPSFEMFDVKSSVSGGHYDKL